MSDQTTLEVVLSSESTVGNPIIETVTVTGTVPIGPRGPAGPQGDDGPEGPEGPAGEGVPSGGTAGQVLTKDSGTDFDTSWQDPTGGGGSGVVESIVAGSNVDVDATDPANPIVSMETLVDADIPASIARDSEVTSAIATSEAGQVRDGDTAGGVLSGTYPNPGFAADMATQAELDAGLATKQPLDADLTALAAAGNSAVLAATTASFLTADETKLDGIEAGAQVNPTSEAIQDIVGAMVTGGTETGIAVSYDDTNARLDFVAEVTQAELDAVEDGLVSAIADGDASTLTSAQSYADGKVSDTAYGAGWDADTTHAPSKNAVYDKIESLGGGSVDDTAYDATSWNGVTTTAPSKNAVRDEMELRAPKASPALTGTPTAPTAAQGTNTTQLATTAYVQTEAGLLVPKSLFDANTMLVATSDNTPVATTYIPFTDYSPTVTQNGTRTTSAMTARYAQIGKQVTAWGSCTLSQAGSAGNAINVALPVSAAAGQTFCGVGAVKDTGTAFYDALVLITGSNIGFFSTVQPAASAEAYIGATPSFALASGDQIYWRIHYEAA